MKIEDSGLCELRVGIAVGLLKGWEALKTQIEPDGTVHNICYGTMCSEDINYYLNRPFYDNDTHGLFAVLFAGMEVNNLIRSKI